LRSKDGSIATLGAITIALIVLLVAVGVDSTRLVQASTKLKALNDMAALAATTGQNKTLEERRAIYESVMETGIENSNEISGYEYDLTFEDDGFTQVLNVTSRSKADLFFAMTRGEGKYVSAHSEVTVGREFIEISLVLDISTSMEGPRIIELQNSAKEFVESMMGNEEIEGRVSIAIVPFGGTVKLPNDLQDMLIQPATTAHWINNTWNGCLSISPVDYTVGLTPQQRLEHIPDFYSWRNSWCPESGNELIGLTDNKTALTNKIDNFTLSDGTGTDIGVAWGLATLDPRWRRELQGVNFRSPRNFNARTRKIMIVMTDGGITSQHLPLDNEKTGTPPFNTFNQINTKDDAKNGYWRVCDLSKSKGIEVYTVAFLINNPDTVDALHRCGTSTSHNFEAGRGQLGTAFENIAASIAGLRLSQ